MNIEELRSLINYHSNLYYTMDEPEISDFEYDALMNRLKEMERQNPELITPDSPTQRIGGKILEGFEEVTHTVQMQSLNDVFDRESVMDFGRKTEEALSEKVEYITELKIDGLSVSLEYRDGYFFRGSTRGDGIKGEDVTENLRTIKMIPKELPEKLPKLIVRGEVYMRHAVFEELNFIKGGVLGVEFLPVCSFLSRIIRYVWAIDENKGQLCLDYRLINVDVSGGAES